MILSGENMIAQAFGLNLDAPYALQYLGCSQFVNVLVRECADLLMC